MEHILFVGNPRAGKSTLINAIAKQVVRTAGLHVSGLTTLCQWHSVDSGPLKGCLIGDTPGLTDPKRRTQCALEITKGLKEGGSYRILVVCRLDSGAIKDQDLVTINSIMEAIELPPKSKPPHPQYAIIFNQVSPEEMAHLDELCLDEESRDAVVPPGEFPEESVQGQARITNRAMLLAMLEDRLKVPPVTVHFVSADPCATLKNNKLLNAAITSHLESIVFGASCFALAKEFVADIKADEGHMQKLHIDLERKEEAFLQAIRDNQTLKAKLKAAETKYDSAIEAHDKRAQQLRLDHDSELEKAKEHSKNLIQQAQEEAKKKAAEEIAELQRQIVELKKDPAQKTKLENSENKLEKKRRILAICPIS